MTQWSDVIAFSQLHEVDWPRDPAKDPDRWGVHHPDPPPWNRLLGPVHERGPVSGVIRQRGEMVAQWGEPHRSDLTFSVAKTYLAMLAGIAHDEGLLPDVDEPVSRRLKEIGFDSPHNQTITWRHLLTQVSEWEGNCLGIEDTVDRYRVVSHDPRPVMGVKGTARPLQTPGTYWEYNDVRINQLSLALLHLFGKSLPDVWREKILTPIGATDDAQWRGYDDAWVDLPAKDGRPAQRVKSVPGGTHWGAGVSISAHDQALIGQLMLQKGAWFHHSKKTQVISAHWINQMMQPCPLASFYGWLVWLNTDRTTFTHASEQSYLMVGAGGNYVWIMPEEQTVVVVRWLESNRFDGFVERVMKALN